MLFEVGHVESACLEVVGNQKVNGELVLDRWIKNGVEPFQTELELAGCHVTLLTVDHVFELESQLAVEVETGNCSYSLNSGVFVEVVLCEE